MSYSNISKELTTKLSKTIKKNGGIYFTPPSIILNNIKLLEPYMNFISNILEPSCGSCEYINALINNYKHLKITGIELNSTIYESIKELDLYNVKLYNIDYLKYDTNESYDLIIGNPPYFVMKKETVDKSYYKYFEGRPNIFILFIIKSITLVKTNGIISFILPKNFLNCLYYDKTRKYINTHFQILNIVECVNSKYIETQQPTIILIIKKLDVNLDTSATINCNFVLEHSNYTIFASKANCAKLKNLILNSKSLDSLGFKVGIGSIVWNQCKELLTNDITKTRLIYSSSIENNNLILQIYNNTEKKNFIDKKGLVCPMIVVNRGYGMGNYKFNYCLINQESEYLLENHLITIQYNKTIPRDELVKLYKKIIRSLEHSNTCEFVEIYFGNNAINSTELSNILPIYQEEE